MLGNFRKYKRFGLMPTAFWLFLHLAMTGIFLPANASTNDDGFFAEPIFICSPTGLKTVTLNADGTFSEENSEKIEFCPWCLHFSGSAFFLTPVSAPISLPDLTTSMAWVAANQARYQHTSISFFQSRAPPL